MAIFEEVRLTWKDKEFVIPPEAVLKGIAKVEDIVTLDELLEMQVSRRVKHVLVSQAYAALLRHAGAVVEDGEVFRALYPSSLGGTDGHLGRAKATLISLVFLMMPPEALREKSEDVKKDGAASEGAASSQASTSSSSAAGNLP